MAFGVVVEEDVIGCLKFNIFFKLCKHRIRVSKRELNCALKYLNLQIFVQVKEVSLVK